MKRVLIAMLLVLALLSTGIASGSYVQAKTQKYWVYDSAQAKVKGNKLVVKAPLYVGEKKIKKNSPSHVWRDEIGLSMAEGVAVGIERGEKIVNDSVGSMADSSLETAKDTLGVVVTCRR